MPVIRAGPVSGIFQMNICGTLGNGALSMPSIRTVWPIPAPWIVRRLLTLTLAVQVHWPAGIATVSPSLADLRALATSVLPQVVAVMVAAKAGAECERMIIAR